MKILDDFTNLLILVAAILIFPILYFYSAFQVETENQAKYIIDSFSKQVAVQGKITAPMYEKLITDLESTGNVYHIELSHSHVIYEPEYDYTGIQDIIDNSMAGYTGENTYTFIPVITTASVIEDPNKEQPFEQIETNETVIASFEKCELSSEHIHAPSCYNFESNLMCSQIITSVTATNPVQCIPVGGTPITTVIISHLDGSNEILALPTDFSTGTEIEKGIMHLEYIGLIDANTQQIFQVDCEVTVRSPIHECPNGHSYYLNAAGEDEGCPFCSKEVSEVSAYSENTEIYIEKGTTLQQNNISLKVTYMDGTIDYTYDYSDNLDKDYVGEQLVTLGYEGNSASITVTTKAHTKKCANCYQLYYLYPDDSDPGCPYCLSSIGTFTGNVMEYTKENYTTEILEQVYGTEQGYIMEREDYFEIIISFKKRDKSLFGKNDSTYMLNSGVHIRDVHIE